jgi:hypothetical protein
MSRREGKGRRCAATVVVLAITCVAGAQDRRLDDAAVQILRALEAEIRDARLLDMPTLAPAAFGKADETYRALSQEVAAGMTADQARPRAEAIHEDLKRGFGRAEATKRLLRTSHKSREDLGRISGLKPDAARLGEAEAAFGRAVQAAEAGDEQLARRLGAEAAASYRAAVFDPFGRGEVEAIKARLEEARGKVAPEILARARRELDALTAEIERTRGEDVGIAVKLADWRGRLDGIIVDIYPPFFRHPPGTILLGNFELIVESYETKAWDFANDVIIGADGLAWISFDCNGLSLHPSLPGIAVELVPWTLRVVGRVANPTYEIAIQEAVKIDPRAELGKALELRLPKDRDLGQEIKASRLAEQLHVAEGLLGGVIIDIPKGDVLVHFDDLTIAPTTVATIGRATTGTASYPATPRIPFDLVLNAAGFRLHLDTLVITTTTATGTARLEMPESVIDGGGCKVAELALGTITIDVSCRYHGEFLSQPWGPWIIGNTGMVVQGTGFVVDLDPAWKWPGWTGFPPQADAWQGVILPSGATIAAASGSMTSNIGYLKAAYSFANGLVTGGGLSAGFPLASPYRFKTLLPFGFDVDLQAGFLRMQNSRIEGGSFIHGGIDFPNLSVSNGTGGGVKAGYTLLSVQEDLDLYAEIDVTSEIHWGEYVNTAPPQTAYSVTDPRTGWFFVAGRYMDPKLPVNPGGFEQPGPVFPPAPALEAKQIHGAFLTAFEQMAVRTRDVPAPPAPLIFRPVNNSWVNVVGQGVHASFDMIPRDPPVAAIGPKSEPTYVGKVPFGVIWQATPDKPRIVAVFRFVDSAVFESDARGVIDVKGPTNAMVPFNRLAATSTAHLPGASIDLSNPIMLDYWGLGVVQKPGFSSAGVMSVKTGQIVLTAAGLTEFRHFAAPFWMTWMEILANGELGRIFFDFNGSGQQFDGFPFTLKAIGLSAWEPADTTGEKAFLQAGGTAHFDFFGADYLNVKDRRNPTMPAAPFDGRRIELATDTAFATEPTDFTIAGEWGNGFGNAAYTIAYDDVDQDGFLGTGTFGVEFILDGDMASTITMARDLICMRVSETNRHDFKAGPIAHFGAMSRISGCACIEDGQLKRLLISSELEATANANVALRSGAYGKVEYLLTPSVSDLRVRGNLYLSILIGGDVELNGAARFVVDRAAGFVEGEIEGSFNSYRLLSGVSAEGKLNWHLGSLAPDGYQLIQGRLMVTVISPVSGNSIEGGLFIGQNAPKEKAWILKDKDGRFDLNTSALPPTLTGIYGYVRASRSVNLWIVSGGVEVFAALGGFVDVGGATAFPSGAGPPSVPVSLPFVVGNFGVRIWGEIAGGLVSASAWGNFQVIAPYPFQFQGTLGLEGCVLWVACASVDVTAGVNTADGFYVE